MIPTFTYGQTTVQVENSVMDPDWGQSQDLEHESVISHKRQYVDIGDHAEVNFTVYLFNCSVNSQNAIKACRGQEGTLTTDLGSGKFRCTQIKYSLLDNISTKKYCVMTFRSMEHV